MRQDTQGSQMQAMVLAAGFGTRLWPLTVKLAKPAVPFLGKALVAHCVELLNLHGIDDIAVNTHYQPDSIRKALLNYKVALSHEEEILGTAGAIRYAVNQGKISDERPLMIINGKLFTNIDLSHAIERHHASGAEITMILRPNPKREAFREIICEGDTVIGFGKNRQPDGLDPLLFTGIHILSPKVLQSIPPGNSDTIKDTYPPFLARKEVHAVLDRSPYWWEFSTLKRYVQLHAQAHIEGFGPLNTIAENAEISNSSRLRNCIVGEKARIGKMCELDHVVIGEGVELPPNSEISDVMVVNKSQLTTVERGEIRGDHVIVPLA